MSNFPQIFRVRQSFARPRLANVASEVHTQLAALELHRRVRPGQSVAITAGSRGIANMAVILRAAVEHLRGLGAEPFLVPAMGSHGGGTAEGQRQVLDSYGITEAAVGCPIRSSMETAIVGHAAEGFPCTSIARPPPPITCWSAAASNPIPLWPATSKAAS